MVERAHQVQQRRFSTGGRTDQRNEFALRDFKRGLLQRPHHGVAYTAEVLYRDPNPRGYVEGREPLRRYLRKLFTDWRMHWEKHEVFPFAEATGAALLWRATFARPGIERVVIADGMDLALIRDDRLSRNEVYFDRGSLAPLILKP